jgi:ubiquinone/menaquinone biosynthesis C-methylase UbiE
MSKPEPRDPKRYSSNFNTFYTIFSPVYDSMVKHSRKWQGMIGHAIPQIKGPRVLEVSVGTGWLISQYAERYDTYGVDLNTKMLRVTSRNLRAAGKSAKLQQANVEALPFRDEAFDTIVNTTAFSGYPRADRAMSEFYRVLKADGRLVLIDIGYPEDRNTIGMALGWLTEASGDILRDMGAIFSRNSFRYSKEVFGLYGTLSMYIAEKNDAIE